MTTPVLLLPKLPMLLSPSVAELYKLGRGMAFTNGDKVDIVWKSPARETGC